MFNLKTSKMKTIEHCHQCKKEIIAHGIGTGYGLNDKKEKICYQCCGENDKKQLLETGKLSGYFSKNKDNQLVFSNWPGSLSIPIHFTSKSHHNFAGRNGRTDFWFKLENKVFHGVYIGFNHQCATVKVCKRSEI